MVRGQVVDSSGCLYPLFVCYVYIGYYVQCVEMNCSFQVLSYSSLSEIWINNIKFCFNNDCEHCVLYTFEILYDQNYLILDYYSDSLLIRDNLKMWKSNFAT